MQVQSGLFNQDQARLAEKIVFLLVLDKTRVEVFQVLHLPQPHCVWGGGGSIRKWESFLIE